MEATETAPDGRRSRWDGHRLARREELVDATLRAIRTHGAAVGMDEVATSAGTSKTVFYRHFTDRGGLYTAVAEVLAWVYRLKRWQAEGGEAPRTPGDLAIPQDLGYNVQAA